LINVKSFNSLSGFNIIPEELKTTHIVHV